MQCKRAALALLGRRTWCPEALVDPLVHGPPGYWRAFAAAAAQKLLLIHPRQQTFVQIQEAMQLAETYAGAQCPVATAGSARGRFSPQPATYFGSGAVEEMKAHCELHDPNKVFVNVELSGVQLRNLEAAWGRPVLDRVGLIIEIFAQRARTREARLQVEMAALEYKSSRLVRAMDAKTGARGGFGSDGRTEVVSARERGRSGGTSGGLGGASGGGETELQLQRRRLASRIKALKRKLDEVRRTRELQRLGRQRAGKAVVAVVGYTNAGKSSIVQALSHRPIASKDRLFETLDPTLRRVYLPSGQEALVSDTVGFISDLPHSLITAFQATLEEVVEADLLLHVLDASSPDVAAQRETVYDVLRQLRVPEARLQSNLIEVWNKVDLPLGVDAHLEASATASSDESLDSWGCQWGEHENSGAEEETWSRWGTSEDEEGGRVVSGFRPMEGGQQDTASVPGPEERSSSREGMSLKALSLEGPMRDIARQDGRLADRQAGADAASSPVCGSPAASAGAAEALDRQSFQGVSSSGSAESTAVERGRNDEKRDEAESGERGYRDAVWALIKQVQSASKGPQPKVLLTSALTKEGLPTLRQEIDRMVSVKCAIEDLKSTLPRMGPKALAENVVGPAQSSEMRRLLPRRTLPSHPLSAAHAKRIAIWQAA